MTVEEGYRRCTELASTHYENFPVGRLVPAELRPHVHAVYAFARIADDIADEGYVDPRAKAATDSSAPTGEERVQALENYGAELDAVLKGDPADAEHAWIFLPVRDTIEKFDLPPQLFHDLLSAFKQDSVKTRYADRAEVLDYCTRSANPIGRLVLLLHRYREPELHQLSDHICTALQLANFWQDVSVDLGKDRIYLPQDELAKFEVTEAELFDGKVSDRFLKLMKFQVEETQKLFDRGKSLPAHLHGRLRWEIRLTWLGGATVLRKIRAQGYDSLSKRPKLRWPDALWMVPYAFFTR
jgi:squalene synthase HpnC